MAAGTGQEAPVTSGGIDPCSPTTCRSRRDSASLDCMSLPLGAVLQPTVVFLEPAGLLLRIQTAWTSRAWAWTRLQSCTACLNRRASWLVPDRPGSLCIDHMTDGWHCCHQLSPLRSTVPERASSLSETRHPDPQTHSSWACSSRGCWSQTRNRGFQVE